MHLVQLINGKNKMAIAYIVQVNFPAGTKYLGPSLTLIEVPKFFKSESAVKRALYRSGYCGSGIFFSAEAHSKITQVIVIRELENGLKDSKAEILSYDEFMDKDFSKKISIENNEDAVYKIRLALPLVDGRPRFAWKDSLGQKFGHVWAKASCVRNHISGDVEKLQHIYSGAQVLEIEMGVDGVTAKSIKEYPIVDFYCASPSSRKRYNASVAKKDAYEIKKEYK